MSTRALNTALLLMFLLQLGRCHPTQISDGYMDAYGPAYSNGLVQETGVDYTGMDYSEGQRETEGYYMEAAESHEEAMKDIPQVEYVKTPRQKTEITVEEEKLNK